MKKTVLAVACGAVLFAALPGRAQAQTKVFGDWDNFTNPEDEIFFAYICISYAYGQTQSTDLRQALIWLDLAERDYTREYNSAFNFGISEFSSSRRDVANAASNVLVATYTPTTTGVTTAQSSVIFGQGGTATIQTGPIAVIDGTALQAAIRNINNVPGWAANPGSSNQFAWWGLWLMLYAYGDLNAMQTEFGG